MRNYKHFKREDQILVSVDSVMLNASRDVTDKQGQKYWVFLIEGL